MVLILALILHTLTDHIQISTAMFSAPQANCPVDSESNFNAQVCFMLTTLDLYVLLY